MKALTTLPIALLLIFWNCSTFITNSYKPQFPPERQSENIRVLLTKNTADWRVESPGKIEVTDVNGLFLKRALDQLVLNPAILKAEINIQFQNNRFTFNGKRYRGSLQLRPANGEVYTINVLPLEEYLLGVVPSEVPASWPREALKAQAVSARTFAVREMLNRSKFPYDVDSTTNSQVYTGLEKEDVRTTEAVEMTRDVIITYKGEPIYSFFHSNSGGLTEKAENVWGGKKLDYLTVVRSDYCKAGEKSYSWEKTFTFSQIQSKLNSLNIGEILTIEVPERTESNRAGTVWVEGSNGTKKLKANDFRNLVGNTELKSLRFRVDKTNQGFQFKGFGFGHGVGMSQWGSYAMAMDNNSYKEILNFYYRGVELAKIVEP